MDSAAYISRLHILRMERADQALSGGGVPQPEYEFGRQCGFNQGLRAAEHLIAEIIEEEREADT